MCTIVGGQAQASTVSLLAKVELIIMSVQAYSNTVRNLSRVVLYKQKAKVSSHAILACYISERDGQINRASDGETVKQADSETGRVT